MARTKKAVGKELRQLVKNSLKCLARHYTDLYGPATYKKYSQVSAMSVQSRSLSYSPKFKNLTDMYEVLSDIDTVQQKQIAHGFALQMEITNCCENAYRSYRWQQNDLRLKS